jgi:hypothetical protein
MRHLAYRLSFFINVRTEVARLHCEYIGYDYKAKLEGQANFGVNSSAPNSHHYWPDLVAEYQVAAKIAAQNLRI